jgi:hypothetical protein
MSESGRRAVLAFVLVVACTAGGCLGVPVASDSPANDSRTTTVASASVPDGPAKQFALDAEEAYLESVLSNASCLDSWGTSPTVTTEEATVVERSAAGVRVEVRHPLSYSIERTNEDGTMERVHADGASEATYLITENGTERLTGDTPSPC